MNVKTRSRARFTGRALAVTAIASVLAGGLCPGSAQAAGVARSAPRGLSGTYENVVSSVDETQDWCNGMGCAEHQHTHARLLIRYQYVEDDDGNVSANAISARVEGETRTWTDLKLAGFHASSQVALGPVYFQTPQYRYGVDGQWIGQSDRTDVWDVSIPLKTAMADRASKGGFMDINFSRG